MNMFKAIERVGRNALRSVLVSGAIAAMQRRTAGLTDVEAAVQFAEAFNHLGIKIAAIQIREEITGLLNLLARNPPQTLVEIGTAKGGTFFLFSRVAAQDALLISLDLPRGKFGGGYAPWQARLYRAFARDQQRIDLLLGNSHQPETCDRIKQAMQGRLADFLFIDGDHTYDGVKNDFALYAPLVRPQGLIGFHDIVPGPEKRVGGVPRFWQEIKPQYRTSEFVANWNQGAYGIGVIHSPATRL